MPEPVIGFDSPDRRVWLQARLSELRKRHKNQRATALSIVVVCAFFIAVCLFAIFSFPLGQIASFILGITAFYCAALVIVGIVRLRERNTDIQDLENELDLLSMADAQAEQRAEKQFRLHQFELKKYYDQTLSHSSWIFWVGVLCILLGFGSIGGAIFVLASSRALATSLDPGQIVVAVLGAVGGVLSNFIAVVYLKMYSETIESLTVFHNRLVETHHLHFGNFLVAKIQDKELREKTLAAIATSISEPLHKEGGGA